MTDEEEDAAIVAAGVSRPQSRRDGVGGAVETEDQARALIGSGCDQAPGFHFGARNPG